MSWGFDSMRIGVVVAICGSLMADAAMSDVLSSRNRKSLFSSQTKILDSRASKQYSSSVRLKPATINTPTKWGGGSSSQFKGKYKGKYISVVRAAARRHGIPEDLFLRLIQQESNWNPRAKSHAGAFGLAQLIPSTARYLGVDINDPHQNVDGGARYLKEQYRTFGSWRLALAAYNAGPGAVKKYGGVPPFRETRNYVKIIWGS
jgi:soluble lytic murein transglycosylase-like protein